MKIVGNDNHEVILKNQPVRVKRLVVNGNHNTFGGPYKTNVEALDIEEVMINGNHCQIPQLLSVDELVINGNHNHFYEAIKIENASNNGNHNTGDFKTTPTAQVNSFGSSYTVSIGGNVTAVGNGTVTVNGVTYKGNNLSIIGNKKYIDGKPISECTPL